MESVAILSHSFINLKGSIIPCRTAIVDLGINQVDPGLAPDGAKCGEGKVTTLTRLFCTLLTRKEIKKKKNRALRFYLHMFFCRIQMCVNQKCMAVSSLQKKVSKCPHDCNGNGVCNSLGHCHCKAGFAPPHCDYPGVGGSEDSGPASDPDGECITISYLF